MASTRVIDAEHLKCVLFTRRLSRFAGYQGPKWAAMSDGHNSLGMGCPRRPYDEGMQRALKHPPLFMPGNRLSPRLVERVRLNHGLAEVKATWATGYKALLAELQPKKDTTP